MAHWGYGKCCGPETWSKGYSAAGGKHQSPINIVTDNAEYDSDLEKNSLSIKFHPEKSDQQTLVFSGHNFKIESSTEPVTVSGGAVAHIGVFKFVQLHFHWGNSDNDNGSEHWINGQQFPVEMHMVFYNSSKYRNFNEAAVHSDGILVFGIFIKIGEKNPELDKLMRPLSSIRSLEKANLNEEHAELCLQRLFPENTNRYYTYSGSLTTPPCYESVTWIVFEQNITMTTDQILQFRWTHMGDDCDTFENFRPVCPLNDRKVKKSFK